MIFTWFFLPRQIGRLELRTSHHGRIRMMSPTPTTSLCVQCRYEEHSVRLRTSFPHVVHCSAWSAPPPSAASYIPIDEKCLLRDCVTCFLRHRIEPYCTGPCSIPSQPQRGTGSRWLTTRLFKRYCSSSLTQDLHGKALTPNRTLF